MKFIYAIAINCWWWWGYALDVIRMLKIQQEWQIVIHKSRKSDQSGSIEQIQILKINTETKEPNHKIRAGSNKINLINYSIPPPPIQLSAQPP